MPQTPAKTTRASSGWSPERRARQSAMMRANRIWQKSTGPKTDEGKAKSAQNALKHGCRSAEFQDFLRVLAAQRRYVQGVMARLALTRAQNKNMTNELLKPSPPVPPCPPREDGYRANNNPRHGWPRLSAAQ